MHFKRPLFLIVIYIIGGLVLTLGLIYLVIRANGYRFNAKTMRLQKTGIISLKWSPRDVSLDFDGKRIEAKGGSWDRFDLLPGRYSIKLHKDGYLDWDKTLVIEAGLVAQEKYIRLFRKDPPREITVEPAILERFAKSYQDFLARKAALTFDNSEIRLDGVLVTRLSEPIQGVVLWEDGKHIIFQSKNKLRVIELDGKNDTVLIELPSEETVQFMPGANNELLVLSGGVLTSYQIE